MYELNRNICCASGLCVAEGARSVSSGDQSSWGQPSAQPDRISSSKADLVIKSKLYNLSMVTFMLHLVLAAPCSIDRMPDSIWKCNE